MNRIDKFKELRLSILDCKTCEFKDKEAAPVYFDCYDPSGVEVLIVTEQPNISCEGISKAVNGELKSDMVSFLQELFGDEMKHLIAARASKIYWTHQTKCCSSKREVKKNCSHFLKEEISMFDNLKVVLTLGAEAFNAIYHKIHCENESYKEYLWKEITMIAKDDQSMSGLVNPNKILLYSIPHPSKKNPLSIFNDYFARHFLII